MRQLVVSSSPGSDFHGAESSKPTFGKNDQGVQSLPAKHSSASSSMSVQSVLRTSVESQLKDRRAESVPEVLARLVHDETFWLILASRISFVSVRQFSAYLPFYLTTVYGIAASSAASTAASFAVSFQKFCNVFDKAIYNFIQALEANPRDLEALYNLGICYQKDDNVKKACKCFLEGAEKGDLNSINGFNKYCKDINKNK